MHIRAVLVILAILLFPIASHSSVVFYAPFDGTVDARIGKHVTGQVHDGPASYEDGKRGKALLAGDGNAYISFNASNIPGKEGSIEFWIKPLGWDAISTDTFHSWVETPQDDKGNWFVFYKYYNDQSLRLIRESGPVLVERKCFPWNGWIHLAVTWSPRGSTIYWNAVPSGTSKPVNPPERYVGRMLVGDRAWGGDAARQNEQTLIDEFYIYDRALEPEEIKWAYENAKARIQGADIPSGLVPMKVHAKILPSKGKVVAEIKPSLAAEELSRVTGTVELIGPTPIAKKPLAIEGGTLKGEFSFTKLDPGKYKLQVELRDSAGKVVDQGYDEFICPANEWLGNKIGVSDTPPPPFTPIQASSDSFACLRRKYAFDRAGLPGQIISAGVDMLRAPVSLSASSEGSKISWQYGAASLVEKSAVAAEYSGRWKGSSAPSAAVSQYVGPGGLTEKAGSPVLQMDWKASAEYDGMIKYTLTLTPTAKDVEIDNLELRFPMRGELATLINSGAYIGAVPAGDGPVIEAPTANWWWLGNEDVGLAAFYESDEAWDRLDRADGFRIERNGDTVEAIWSFIGTRVKLDKPWTFTFGMTATPVKITAGLSGRPSRIMYHNAWLMNRTFAYTDDGLAAIIENEGIRDKVWSNFHVLWLGGPWTQYPLDWRSRPSALDFMPAAINEKLKAKGLSPIQYFLPREVTESIPEWRFWSAEWEAGQKITWTDEPWDSTTCTQSWVDFIVWYMVNNMEKYGFSGQYVDNALPPSVINPDAGAGYIRDGVMCPTTPWFAVREIFKRLYTAVKLHGTEKHEPTMIMAHHSGVLPVSHLAFMDNRLDGEQFQHQFRHVEGTTPIDVIPLERWRAQLLSTNIGNMCNIIVYTEQRNRSMTSLLLLHNVGTWFTLGSTERSPEQQKLHALHDMWTLQDVFGVQDAEFLPYWKNQAIIGGQTETLKVSAYRKPKGGALLVIANVDKKAQDVVLQIDWERLKSSGQLVATDAETGESLQVIGKALRLKVQPLDYRAVFIR
ncbi:MAG: glycoside hydrolase domain-containing protein [Armatimonadota bacterium]